jgi:MFS transporter, SP family, general alpha glucoside:H+ symporter
MADAETEKRVVSNEPGTRHDEEHDATSTADREASGWVGLTVEARNATEHEHQMSLWQALKLYPRACWWSFVVSLVVIMDGYDTALIGMPSPSPGVVSRNAAIQEGCMQLTEHWCHTGTLFGFPAFQSRFGIPVAGTPGKYQLEAKWQTALGLASPLGNIVGIFINGWMTERIGHKKTLIITMFYLTGCIFIAFFAPNVETLFVGRSTFKSRINIFLLIQA